MAFFKESEFSNVSDNFTKYKFEPFQKSMISEGKKVLEKTASIYTDKFDIFISHSKLDEKIVGGLYLHFTQKGFNVYVDWIVDPELDRSRVNLTTCKRLRERMNQSKSMIVATSNNSLDSKWVTWEIGFFDGRKGKVSIMPILKDYESTFSGSEFLHLYPKVEKGLQTEQIFDTQKFYGFEKKSLNEWVR